MAENTENEGQAEGGRTMEDVTSDLKSSMSLILAAYKTVKQSIDLGSMVEVIELMSTVGAAEMPPNVKAAHLMMVELAKVTKHWVEEVDRITTKSEYVEDIKRG